MFSLILVNLWLGYPYMFLVCTGALQSIPTDLKEAAYVDGATGLHDVPQGHVPAAADGGQPAAHRQLRLQLQQLHARLPAHRRRPASSGESAGATDILLIVDVPHRPRRRARSGRASAAALSVLIFLIVAVLSAHRVQVHQDVRGGAVDDQRPSAARRRRRRRRPAAPIPGWRPALVRRRPAGATSSASLALFFALFPVWFVLIAAFSENGTLSSQTLLPESFTLKQYRRARRRLPVLALVRQLADHQPRRRLRHRAAGRAGGLRVLPAALPRAGGRAARAAADPDVPGRRWRSWPSTSWSTSSTTTFPALGAGLDRRDHALLPRRRARGERLADQGLLRHDPPRPRRERPDRRGDPRPDVLQDHPPARRAGAGDHLPARRSSSSQAEFLVASVDPVRPGHRRRRDLTVAVGLQRPARRRPLRPALGAVRDRRADRRRSRSCCCSSSCSASSSAASPPAPSRADPSPPSAR